MIPVYGLYADAKNTVILSDESGAESRIIIHTRPLPWTLRAFYRKGKTRPHIAEASAMFFAPPPMPDRRLRLQGRLPLVLQFEYRICRSQTCKRQYSDRDGASGRSAIQYKAAFMR